jgi:integrase
MRCRLRAFISSSQTVTTITRLRARLSAMGKNSAGPPNYEARVRDTTDLIKKVLRLAGIKEGVCHRFRDTFAINLLVGSGKNGADILSVSQMLGHSDVRITRQHYLKLIPGYRERMSQSTRVLGYQFSLAG